MNDEPIKLGGIMLAMAGVILPAAYFAAQQPISANNPDNPSPTEQFQTSTRIGRLEERCEESLSGKFLIHLTYANPKEATPECRDYETALKQGDERVMAQAPVMSGDRDSTQPSPSDTRLYYIPQTYQPNAEVPPAATAEAPWRSERQMATARERRHPRYARRWRSRYAQPRYRPAPSDWRNDR
jgi:hypothetical protein